METELKEKLLKIKQNDTTWQCTLRRAPIWIALEDIFGNLGLSKNHVDGVMVAWTKVGFLQDTQGKLTAWQKS